MNAKDWIFLILIFIAIGLAVFAIIKKSKVVVKFSRDFEESTAKTIEEFGTDIEGIKESISEILEVVQVRKSKA